ncbi:AAA family ATPase [Thermodesulfobacterium sp. TA1]|uniref:UvrD-helicase domain-containing protein n=1 Tax=Thermodesulfobacterium sp. TA1 TaxID=2234087 RepID=UPI0012324A7B|nr:UvrD-helicase domain-containing protein [Thermodesulfobacterium sp. TA1]QER42538.1 AAA family ATPase [Thermodesulfobacterium sp. TA1]
MGSNIILYKASAGSGKTYNLALKFLEFVSKEGKESLRNLLAITFTNKAAFEMKQRIITFLKEIVKQTEKGKDLSAQLNLSPEKAEELLVYLFSNYDYLQVKTIDSFLLTLYKAISYELGLETDFKVSTYIKEELIEKALTSFYPYIEQDKDLKDLLEKFIETLLMDKESLKINFKNTFVLDLKKILEKITYHKELLTFLNKEELIQHLEERGKIYFKFYSVLRRFLEQTFFEEKEIFIGLWKEKIASFLLKEEQGILPWVYVKLGNLKGVIIDEFQDTDRLQWEALQPIIEDLVSKQGLLVCAGDPKQSIFQWRGGDPTLFKEVLERFKYYEIKEEVLSNNYRSSRVVIEFNNRFFEKLKEEPITQEALVDLVFAKRDNEEDKKKVLKSITNEFQTTFEHVSQNPVQTYKGRVEVRTISIDKTASDSFVEKAKEEILRILEELKPQEGLKDVALLLRENKEVIEFSSFLISQGFHVLSSSSLHLKESLAVNTLVSILKFIAYPDDEVSLATCLSGPAFPEGKEILEEYLSWLINGNSFTLLSFLKDIKADFWKTRLSPLLSLKKGLSLYKLVLELVKTLEIEKQFPLELAYLYKFLTVVFTLDRRGEGLEEFLLYWEKYSEDELDIPQVENCIKVLTLHKAKGLEFETVILPLGWTENRFSSDLKLVFYNGKVFYGKKEELPEEGKLGWYLDKAKNRLELLNLLYVGLTRAKKNLFILCPDQIGGFSPIIKIFRKVYDLLEKENLEINNSFSS